MRQSIALAVLALLGLPAGASAATLGEQRVLLILTTWGPEPYVAVRVGGGRHRLRVVAVDRAGNRSRSAGRIVRP